jgi:hypothetical protein
MRVLFDQATPVPIRPFLVGHTVHTAAQQHWDTLKNGDLLAVAEQAGFEVFLTTDKNMRRCVLCGLCVDATTSGEHRESDKPWLAATRWATKRPFPIGPLPTARRARAASGT